VRFEFATAGRIVFGRGVASQLPALVREFGTRALLVTGRSPRAVPLSDCERFEVAGEPTVEDIRQGAGRAHGCDLVVSIGGGSVIDAGKAIAAVCRNSGEPLDYLEVVGQGRPLENPPLPFVAVPTTAGTGAEVTRNAVLGSPEHRVKASLRSALMLPRVALVDPELTRSLPAAVTVSTGLDALTQLIEPYVSPRATPMTDALCLSGIELIRDALPRAHKNGEDLDAREAMSLASLYGGIALANAGLGVVHGFAAPIGGMLNLAHGAICAALLPRGMKANIRALRERDPHSDALARYGVIAQVLTGRSNAVAEDGAKAVAELCDALEVPALNIHEDQRSTIVEKAAKASSMKANPIVLTQQELLDVIS
jgi:alcohol dehydrogenase class IV